MYAPLDAIASSGHASARLAGFPSNGWTSPQRSVHVPWMLLQWYLAQSSLPSSLTHWDQLVSPCRVASLPSSAVTVAFFAGPSTATWQRTVSLRSTSVVHVCDCAACTASDDENGGGSVEASKRRSFLRIARWQASDCVTVPEYGFAPRPL